jgi:hypothetical protein
MAKTISNKVDYAARNAAYIGKTLRVVTCSKDTRPKKKGFFISLASSNINSRELISSYSSSRLKPGSFVTINQDGWLTGIASVSDVKAILKEDIAYKSAVSSLNSLK